MQDRGHSNGQQPTRSGMSVADLGGLQVVGRCGQRQPVQPDMDICERETLTQPVVQLLERRVTPAVFGGF